jgi:hypothetical protein
VRPDIRTCSVERDAHVDPGIDVDDVDLGVIRPLDEIGDFGPVW